MNSGIVGQYSGLASIAGISLPNTGGDITLAVAFLKSRAFFTQYLYDDIAADLFAAKSWDKITRELEYASNVYDKKSKTWLLDATGKSYRPSSQEAFIEFKNQFIVTQDPITQYVTVSVTHISPVVSFDWSARIVKALNEHFRKKDREESLRAIVFLKEQIENTELVSLDLMFAEMLEDQMKTLVLTEAVEEYLFEVVEPPIAPEKKVGPQRALICISATSFGFLFVYFVFLAFELRFLARLG